MNDKLVYREENIISAFIIGMILMFINTVKTMFNKDELINFTMMMGVNIMMFGVVLGFIGVMGQYVGKTLNESKVKQIYYN